MAGLSAQDVIDALDLRPLDDEGGYFRQTWIAHGTDETSPIGTAILYLVTPDSFSALHRLVHDEIFHFYLGDPCGQVIVGPDGAFSKVVLGQDISDGMTVQHVVPAGHWQGTRLVPGGSWALLGTTMAPGFHVSGFELATGATVESFDADVEAEVRAFLAPQP